MRSVISSFASKLVLFKRNFERGEFYQFPSVAIFKENGEMHDDDIQVYCNHLDALHKDFQETFQHILNMKIPNWVIDPFSSIDEKEMELQEELIELQTNEELKLNLWAVAKKLAEKLAFPPSYVVKQGFSVLCLFRTWNKYSTLKSSQPYNMLATASLVLVSCCGCMVVVEKLARQDPECMNLMTFSTFLFVTMEGLVSNPQFIMQKPKIPLNPDDHCWYYDLHICDIQCFHGVCMLTFALVFSSALGIAQEKLYCQYGKHPREAMFFIHMLSLPGFLLFYKDIMKHTNLFNRSELIHLPWIALDIPHLWLLLILVDIAQYFCIRFVYYLTASCSTLTVTLVITIRKFISLISSILLFSSPFTVQHWIGTALVFGGTLLFIEPFKRSNSDKVKTN
ncbi:UDP-xylose and UDP-N-acetylglucosamine transporter [Trichinella zimbabwensis]|uniref:UDP-xylose and UDP-N-acetylglucosamine transporter n=1 Tax=Trichinella zimbabwensis TaxID=268475 RepID=A0A0V1H5M3_9BILA|nr:UDP-xylose and UDP-N-acetylglucosamine transporter [Trichinella zimbabwensis]